MDYALSAIAALAAAIGGYLFEKAWEGRKQSDKNAFWLWRTAFDRSAFKGPFTWHSDQDAFRSALDATTKAVTTGVLTDRQGGVLGRGKPKGELKRPQYRSTMDDVELRLRRIRSAIIQPGAPDRDDVAKDIDDERDAIIRSLNAIWTELGIAQLPVPSDVVDYRDISW